MSADASQRLLLATVDTRELNSLLWGPLRPMFPTFVEKIELNRLLKKLLLNRNCLPVEVAAHEGSSHIFDVFVDERTDAGARRGNRDTR